MKRLRGSDEFLLACVALEPFQIGRVEKVGIRKGECKIG